MIELLAALSLSAATGLRVALPLLLLGLLQGEALWSSVPILSAINPQLLFGFLMSWTISELVLSKWFLGQRILQGVQLLLSPIVGAIASLAAVYISQNNHTPAWLLAMIGALLALVLQLVQVGWFYRLRGLPLWGILSQDVLCLVLVFSAFDAPEEGGLIALLLLWLAIRSSSLWRRQRCSPYHQPSPPTQRTSVTANRRKKIERV